MLTGKGLAGVAPEVDLWGECITYNSKLFKTFPTLAFKSNRDVTTSAKQGHNWT